MQTMNDQNIVPFDFEGKAIRVVTVNNEPWFAAPDVCRVLDLAHVASALRVLDEDEKGVLTAHTLGGAQEVRSISEPGLYKLMARSRKPEARRFDRWVRHEVLPAIRRDGGYLAAAPDETPEALALRALTVLQATVERQKLQLAEAMPKVEALERIANADGLYNLTVAAKTLGQPPQAFIRGLHSKGWIYKREPSSNWIGYQDKVRSGYLAHKSASVTRPDGTSKEVSQVFVTPKGLTRLAQGDLGMSH
jgi:prophage antirepressor-like protein